MHLNLVVGGVVCTKRDLIMKGLLRLSCNSFLLKGFCGKLEDTGKTDLDD